ncbi:signal peptidase I [Hungatella hathewayi]|uniref:Signal peptidase I n=1 Tax=Hungatella hathewayi WAL-18680 TaxID=742737 RepID=G5IIU1_9FIRM|nr:signal peptidase I [Hungatella hathewayi]EHI58726.1 hypothetical protein HMPREF9473_03419 [ [Hungatella hathewayi WAL-18680]
MEMAESRGKSRKSQRKSREKKEERASHFRTVWFGGFEEGQMICYLWEIVKSLEAGQAAGASGRDRLRMLEKQMRGRVRVEMRRYFARRRRRAIRMAAVILAAALCVGGLFVFLIGIDRVFGMSMYPYLNDGDWIVYSRIGKEMRRDEVVVFEKDGESMVKRIAGLPGDTVEINASGSCVIVNGVQVREDYVTLTDGDQEKAEDEMGLPLTVMNGQYLVLGDNRTVSIDSRDSNIGTVPEEAVLGRVIWIVRAGW